MTLNDAAYGALTVLAQGPSDGPVGPEFGKASPIGLLVLVALAVAVLMLGWSFHRRNSRFRRRRIFAEQYGLDPFDQEAVDKAMAEAGVLDRRDPREKVERTDRPADRDRSEPDDRSHA